MELKWPNPVALGRKIKAKKTTGSPVCKQRTEEDAVNGHFCSYMSLLCFLCEWIPLEIDELTREAYTYCAFTAGTMYSYSICTVLGCTVSWVMPSSVPNMFACDAWDAVYTDKLRLACRYVFSPVLCVYETAMSRD